MIRVFGCSDDLVEVEGAPYPADEIGCYDADVVLEFTDGTVARIHYPKRPGLGVWGIALLRKGSAEATLELCEDEDAEVYSDVLRIDAEYKAHWVLEANDPLPAELDLGS